MFQCLQRIVSLAAAIFIPNAGAEARDEEHIRHEDEPNVSNRAEEQLLMWSDSFMRSYLSSIETPMHQNFHGTVPSLLESLRNEMVLRNQAVETEEAAAEAAAEVRQHLQQQMVAAGETVGEAANEAI